jgi:hypothetical protein
MKCLQGLKVNIDLEATDQGPSGDSLSIREEMGLLIEIQDICDELEILKLVLTDQGETMDKMEKVFIKGDDSPKARPKNAILAAHLHRIDRMEKAAAGTRKSVSTVQIRGFPPRCQCMPLAKSSCFHFTLFSL